MAQVERLYPICRSITGPGVRETLAILAETVPLEIHEVGSGTPVLDWTVPPEWTLRGARITGPDGSTVIDAAAHNLHVVSYSEPVRATLPLDELRRHLHSLPDQPDLIPYRTSYYDETWGFCLPHAQLESLPDGDYTVEIDATIESGSLTYGEIVVPGRVADEVLISAHVCHPSLANDNLSGVVIAAALAAELLAGPRPRLTYRFLFAPGTIGAITWLEQNRANVDVVVAGLTLTCLGDSRPFTYKRTADGEAMIDRAAALVLGARTDGSGLIDFFPYGFDERQFNSPGFRMPVGSLMRGRHGQFPEYHTSADDLSFVSADRLEVSFAVLAEILGVVDRNRVRRNLEPYGEPQLGRRGLYGAIGGIDVPDVHLAMLWVLNQSDGTNDLLAIAERSGLDFAAIDAAATVLEDVGLLGSFD